MSVHLKCFNREQPSIVSTDLSEKLAIGCGLLNPFSVAGHS